MSNAIATTNQDLDDSMILGHLFFYTIGELHISGQELADIFTKNGLSSSYVKTINPVDAYRRATSDAKQTLSIQYRGQTKKAKIEVDEVACNATEVVRAVGRKVVDDSFEELSYETVGKIIFDRKTQDVSFVYDGRFSHEYPYDMILNEAVLRFENWTKYHTKETVRNVINTVLTDLHPVNLMPSGMCKFIPNRNKADLYSLQGAVRALTEFGEVSLFESVPVVDTSEMRRTVKNAASTEIENEAALFIQEMQAVLQQKADLSSRAVASYVQKSQELEKKAQEYESLLGIYMGYVRQQIAEVYRMATENQRVAI